MKLISYQLIKKKSSPNNLLSFSRVCELYSVVQLLMAIQIMNMKKSLNCKVSGKKIEIKSQNSQEIVKKNYTVSVYISEMWHCY